MTYTKELPTKITNNYIYSYIIQINKYISFFCGKKEKRRRRKNDARRANKFIRKTKRYSKENGTLLSTILYHRQNHRQRGAKL